MYSVKLTVSGRLPLVGVAVKLATGKGQGAGAGVGAGVGVGSAAGRLALPVDDALGCGAR